MGSRWEKAGGRARNQEPEFRIFGGVPGPRIEPREGVQKREVWGLRWEKRGANEVVDARIKLIQGISSDFKVAQDETRSSGREGVAEKNPINSLIWGSRREKI